MAVRPDATPGPLSRRKRESLGVYLNQGWPTLLTTWPGPRQPGPQVMHDVIRTKHGMSPTIGFTVVYRWQLHEGRAKKFQEAWETATAQLMKSYGALGSRLHLAEDGTWVAYAQWPNKKAWEDSRIADPSDPSAFDEMRDAIARTFEPMLLTPFSDYLVPGRITSACT